ncbi:hypothetical protein GGS20DRAFT_596686 [Poronia punctata]|nr:hypothetical protein GGS20DRAFT_596686 [Poronia punctata]
MRDVRGIDYIRKQLGLFSIPILVILTDSFLSTAFGFILQSLYASIGEKYRVFLRNITSHCSNYNPLSPELSPEAQKPLPRAQDNSNGSARAYGNSRSVQYELTEVFVMESSSGTASPSRRYSGYRDEREQGILESVNKFEQILGVDLCRSMFLDRDISNLLLRYVPSLRQLQSMIRESALVYIEIRTPKNKVRANQVCLGYLSGADIPPSLSLENFISENRVTVSSFKIHSDLTRPKPRTKCKRAVSRGEGGPSRTHGGPSGKGPLMITYTEEFIESGSLESALIRQIGYFRRLDFGRKLVLVMNPLDVQLRSIWREFPKISRSFSALVDPFELLTLIGQRTLKDVDAAAQQDLD